MVKVKKNASPWGPMGDFLNAYCQLQGTRPVFDYKEVKGHNWSGANGWKCTLRVPGTGQESTASGSTKQDAQQAATRDFVIRLQASGVMIKNMPQSQAPTGPSWAIHGGAGAGHSGIGVGFPVPPGKRPKTEGGPQAEPPGKNISAEMSRLTELLRAGKAEEALELAEEQLDGCPRAMTVKQLAKLMTVVGVRSKEQAVLSFFDGLAALQLVDFPNPPAAAYFWRFGRWAVREFLAEGQACSEQASSMIPQVLERNGSCIAHLIVGQGVRGGGELLLTPASGQLPLGHSFQIGDWIFLTSPHIAQVRTHTEGAAAASFEAELISLAPQKDGIVVKVVGEKAAAAQQLVGRTCRIDRAANHVTFGRQINALLVLCTCPGELDWLSLALLAAEEERGFERVAQFCSHFPPGGGFPSASPVLRSANQSQWEALQAATSRRVTLVQGPPGAGKTSTAVLLMRLWVSTGRKPVLATADSNIAADNLVAGCASAGLQVVRVGRKEASRPELQDYNLFEKARAAGCLGGPRHNWRGEKKVLEGADVVCCTCSGAEHPAMQDLKFRNVLVDEAGQTTELATLIPMMHLQADGSVVLVGDHKQLPATVACLEADVEGLGTSLFQRLTSLGVPPVLLDVQYRMHPAIAAFPSQQYYEGRLRTGVAGSARPAPQGIQWPCTQAPVAFLPIQSTEAKEGNSFTNLVEVNTIMELLSSVLASRDIQPNNVGIITPYAAQARLLRAHLGLDAKPARGVSQPEVSSVDGFQGREKDLIFISTVRANLEGKVGFMGDPRRLNVMLTRAKRGLVVVGDFNTLAQDKDGWRPWLIWAQERGLIVGCAATSPAAAAELQRLDGLSQAEVLAATSVFMGVSAKDLGMPGQDDGGGGTTAADAGPMPRPRKKSLLMQIREEAEKAAQEDASKAQKEG